MMVGSRHHQRLFVAGFTLLEMLTVIIIMGMMAGLLIPAVASLKDASKLTSSIDRVFDSIRLARQMSLAKRRSLSVRFFKPSADVDGFTAWQLILQEESGDEKPVGAIEHLPDGIVISAAANHSSVLQRLQTTDMADFSSYAEFRFRRDGSIDLQTTGDWFLAVMRQQDQDKDQPENYAVLLLDPNVGTVKLFRP